MSASAATESAFVHPKAHVEGATLGDRTRVWQFASVIRGAVVGADCNIGAGAVVDGACIGDRCAIASGAFLPPGVELRADVFVGPGAMFCNDYWPSTDKTGFTLASDSRVTLLDRGAVVGAGAIVLPGVRIGSGAMVAAGVVVSRNVPARHVLRRDGTVEPLPEHRPRMRFVV